MAQYDTNFSGYSAGSPPSDWTARWTTTNVTNEIVSDGVGDGGKILRTTSSADARRLLSWDAVDADADRANVEILCRFKTNNVSATDNVRIHVRSSGAAGSENSYHLRLPVVSGANWGISKYVAGVSTAVGSNVSFTFEAGALYNARFRVNGNVVRARLWKDGTNEPSAWQVDTTDTSLSSAGWVGVGRFPAAPTIEVTHFVAATDGDTATWPAAVDTIARATQVAAEVVSQVNPNLVATQVALETVTSNALNMIVTQVALELVSTNVPDDVVPAAANKYRQIQIAC